MAYITEIANQIAAIETAFAEGSGLKVNLIETLERMAAAAPSADLDQVIAAFWARIGAEPTFSDTGFAPGYSAGE